VSGLVTIEAPRSAAAEAYRSLRTNLAFARRSDGPAALLVASPAAGEGKSTTLANLAVVLAQSGRRVIVADCDLRRPAQHALFGLPNGDGVSRLLATGAVEAPPLLPTQVDGLRLLPAGPPPPNPAELLDRPAAAALLAGLRADADVVLVDAPPLLAVTDAALLAARLDGVLLVLAAGKSRRDHAERARELLDRVGAETVGVVLTGVEPEGRLPYGLADGAP
jgi:non-specific protein-tyrosine kinase